MMDSAYCILCILTVIWFRCANTRITDDAYLGCFYDLYHAPLGPTDPQFRVLPHGKLVNELDMTIGRCIIYCVELQDNITLAGLITGIECYCGTADADYDQGGRGRRPDGDCLRPCAGNMNQTCGNDFSIAVYNLSLIRCPLPEEHRFINTDYFVQVQETMTFECLPGYILMGTPTVQCIFDDSINDTRWATDLPLCMPIKEVTPPNPRSTQLISTSPDNIQQTNAPPNNAGAIIAGTVSSICLLIVIGITLFVVVYVRRRRSADNGTDSREHKAASKDGGNTKSTNTDTYLDRDTQSRNQDTEYQGIYTNPDTDNAASPPSDMRDYQDLNPMSRNKSTEYQGIYTNPAPDASDLSTAYQDLDPSTREKDTEYQGIYTNPEACHSQSESKQANPSDKGTRRVPMPPTVDRMTEDCESYYMNVKQS